MDVDEEQPVVPKNNDVESDDDLLVCHHENCDDYSMYMADGAWCTPCKLWICNEHREIYTQCPKCRGRLIYDEDKKSSDSDESYDSDKPYESDSDNARNFCHYVPWPSGHNSFLCGKDTGDLPGALCCEWWTCEKHRDEKKFCDRCGRKLIYP